jgi:hypothetical protein
MRRAAPTNSVCFANTRSASSQGTPFLRRCPILALSMQQGAANGGKGRTKRNPKIVRFSLRRCPIRQRVAHRGKARLTTLFPPVNRRVAGLSRRSFSEGGFESSPRSHFLRNLPICLSSNSPKKHRRVAGSATSRIPAILRRGTWLRAMGCAQNCAHPLIFCFTAKQTRDDREWRMLAAWVRGERKGRDCS